MGCASRRVCVVAWSLAAASSFAAIDAHPQSAPPERVEQDSLVVTDAVPPRTSPAFPGVRVELGVQAGVAIPLSGFEVGPAAGLAVGVRRALGPLDGFIHLQGAFESHAMSGSGDLPCDAVPPSGPCLHPEIAHYTFSLRERELQIGLVLGYRLRRLHPRWSPYLAIAASYIRQRVESTTFGLTNIEEMNSFAVGGVVGVQYDLGLVAPFVELHARYAPILTRQTGQSQVSTLQAWLGIRFAL